MAFLQQKAGIDLTEVTRFTQDRNHVFLKKSFSEGELDYCFSYANPAVHLAGMFAAKEAVAKALGATQVAFIEIEIRHTREGVPEAWQKNERLPLTISITHTDMLAAAIAVG